MSNLCWKCKAELPPIRGAGSSVCWMGDSRGVGRNVECRGTNCRITTLRTKTMARRRTQCPDPTPEALNSPRDFVDRDQAWRALVDAWRNYEPELLLGVGADDLLSVGKVRRILPSRTPPPRPLPRRLQLAPARPSRTRPQRRGPIWKGPVKVRRTEGEAGASSTMNPADIRWLSR